MIRPALLFAVLAFGLMPATQAQTEAPTTYRWVDERGQINYSDLPPPSAVQAVEARRFAAPPPDQTLPYALRKLTEDFPVTLYSSENCGEACAAARALLDGRGVPYTETRIATAEALASYRERFGSPESVPTLTIGSTPYKGFESTAWNRLLDNAGYPKTPVPGVR